MSYQPEERYWTDYLRIALPVVGLLLMLGLFWFWAASLIGDEDDDNPDDLAAVATATVPAQTPTPSAPPVTEAAGDETNNGAGDETEPTDGEETPPADDTSGNADDDEDPGAADDESSGDEGNGNSEESCDTDLCPGDSVITNDPDVRFRDAAGTDSEVIATLPEGTELIVLDDEQVDDGEFIWIPVEDLDGQAGFVASEFLTEE